MLIHVVIGVVMGLFDGLWGMIVSSVLVVAHCVVIAAVSRAFRVHGSARDALANHLRAAEGGEAYRVRLEAWTASTMPLATERAMITNGTVGGPDAKRPGYEGMTL